MKRLIVAALLAFAFTGCVTVNGRSLSSLLPRGDEPAATPASPAGSSPATAPAAKPEGGTATAFLAATQPLVLEADGPENPVTMPELVAGPLSQAAAFKLQCPMINSQGVYQVQPLTRFEVKTRINWLLEAEAPLAVQGADGSCRPASGELAPGSYSLFAVINNREPLKTATLTVANTERRLVVAGDVPRLKLGDVLPQAFELRTVVAGPNRLSLCNAKTTRPALVVELSRPITGSIQFLAATERVHFVAVPVSEVPLRDACTKREIPDELPAGQYALYATSAEPVTAWADVEPRERGSNTWAEEWKWSLRTLREVPASVPLRERELRAWYPWYRSSVAEPIFLQAPKALFVSVSADASPVSVGEPLLLLKYGAEQSEVLRITGERVSVRTERLSELLPEMKVPSFPELKTNDNRFEHWDALAPYSLKPKMQAWRAQQFKHSDCIDAYMRQKDPSWGKPNYVIIVSQREAHLAAAGKRCNSAGLDASWVKLKADVVAERKSLRAKAGTLTARLQK
jgi:hypothetical protein